MLPTSAWLAVAAGLVLLPSCSLDSPGGAGSPLLVDPQTRAYGSLARHGERLTLPLVRGEGVAEWFVPVQIGTTRGWWHVDTGSPFSVVPSRIARHEGFQPVVEGEISTAAGSVDSQLGLLPSVRLGDLELREVSALVLDEPYLAKLPLDGRKRPVIGILGANLLAALDASLDFRSSTLRLRAP